MDVVYRPGGESIYQVGGSRGGVVAGFACDSHLADLENERRDRDAADDGKRA